MSDKPHSGPIRYPSPLQPGSRVVVTAPSSGVQPALHARLELVLAHLRSLGFVVEQGRCLRDQHLGASAPAAQRAGELEATLMRDDVDAVIPPWGGELAIEILDRLDWGALARARPKWVLGYSDSSTWMLPLTLRLGWATAHGPCLMDLVPGQDDVLTRGALKALQWPTGHVLRQHQSRAWQIRWADFAAAPASTYALTEPTHWRSLHGRAHEAFDGRLIGGCLDTLMHTAGTAYGDVAAYIAHHRTEGVILYLENAEQSPPAVVRALHRLRWAGWLDGLSGLLIGRSAAPVPGRAEDLQMGDALRHTLGTLPCPVLLDVDIGHVPPQMVLINGAHAQVRWSAEVAGPGGEWGGGEIVQRLD
ncbi:MAG: LD-carboxypeptidase [Rubrivivax sp.]|nr:LD-carboxypeptidase [Rubrivivax sp.]